MSGVTLSGSFTSTQTLASNPTTLTGAVNASAIGVLGKAGTFWTFANDGIGVHAGEYGVQLAGGIITNALHSTIYGETKAGVYLNYGTVENAGTIISSVGGLSGIGIYGAKIGSSKPGLVVNAPSGYIGHALEGIYSHSQSVTVVNAGTISGSEKAVDLQETGADANALVIVDVGAVFNGEVAVNSDAYSNVLEVAGTGGSLSGVGTKFFNFTTIDFAPGSAWTLSGNSAGLAAGQEIDGFYHSNTIDLTGVAATASSFADNRLTLFNNGTVAAQLYIRENANITNADFTISTDHAGGTDIFTDGKYQVPLTLTGHYSATVDLVTNPTTLTGTVNAAIYGVYGRAGTFWTFASDGGGVTGGTDGIDLVAGRITNGSGSSIEGTSQLGVNLVDGTVDNSGYIGASGGIAGVNIDNIQGSSTTAQAGLLVNRAGGTVSGAVYSVIMKAESATVVNAGVIDGGFFGAVKIVEAASQGGVGIGATALVMVDPGAVFGGNVYTSPGYSNVLEVTGTSALALSGIDPNGAFENFSTIEFAPGAAWTLDGTGMGLANDQKILGFNQHDTIDLTDFAASGSFFSNGILTLTGGGTTENLTISESAAVTSADFIVTPDGNGGTDIAATDAICYVRGTRILTPTGEVPVEALAIGDALVTRFGGIQKIRWIGRQAFDWRFVRHNQAKIPVRIAPGALAEGMPARALAVSPGHAVLLGEVLILARDLVNGVTIKQDYDPARDTGVLEYYQIEFDSHDCVVAEGCWAESFADAPGLRAEFHNAAEFHAHYPEAAPPEGLALCAERPERGARLAAALRPVVARAAAAVAAGELEGWVERVTEWRVEGWALDHENPALPVLVDIWLGEHRLGTALAHAPRADLTAAGKGSRAFRFASLVRLGAAEQAQLRVCRQADGTELPWLHRDTGEALRAMR